MKITHLMIESAYRNARTVFAGNMSRVSGKAAVSKETGMIEGSANDYITVFLAMMNGEEYRRTINTVATDFYLQNIRKDYGEAFYHKAVEATRKHTKYYSNLGKGNLVAIEELVERA